MSAVTSFSKKASSSLASLVSHSMPCGATVKNYSHHTVGKTTPEHKYSSHSDFLQMNTQKPGVHYKASKIANLIGVLGFVHSVTHATLKNDLLPNDT
ncbi:hypothetical protein SD81_029940 [Tolypothrix campylonemoides VB511288]|nr:hypothetical protein SD81_029940 [Tolypothrix campylonemoides VB511288]